MPDRITVVNACPSLADGEAIRWVAAVQEQVTRDFAPAWGASAALGFTGRGQTPPPDQAWIALFDNSDTPGALGYHDLTPSGLPIGKVFVETTRLLGEEPSVCLSHETLEMLADPDCVHLVDLNGTSYAMEVCDAVEADACAYEIGGVKVSDFCLPSYYQPTAVGPFDFQRILDAPIPRILPGGYLIFRRPGGSWQQVHGATADPKALFRARPRVGSRRYRRLIGTGNNLKSVL